MQMRVTTPGVHGSAPVLRGRRVFSASITHSVLHYFHFDPLVFSPVNAQDADAAGARKRRLQAARFAGAAPPATPASSSADWRSEARGQRSGPAGRCCGNGRSHTRHSHSTQLKTSARSVS